jgi:phosphoribosylcarboxyaminoimidazole (NCAIR) mutase
LAATTVNVYEVPFVSPLTAQDRPPPVTHVAPPGEAVTVYPVIGLPPSEDGAIHMTSAEALPAVAVTPVGAPGTVAGTTADDAAEAGPVPIELLAVTAKV